MVQTPGVVGGHSLISGIWRCAAKQGLVFCVRTLELGIISGLRLLDWISFSPWTLGLGTFLTSNSRAGYHFCSETLKMDPKYHFSVQS